MTVQPTAETDVRAVAGNDRSARIASLYGKRFYVLKAGLQATDAVILGAVLLFGLLIAIFRAHIAAPGGLLLRLAAWGALYVGSIYLDPKLHNRVLRFLVRTGAVQILCAQLFLIAQRMQLIVVRSWQDPVVLRLEHAVFGVQPTVWLQRFVTPPLTEWMMFAYVFYVAIYPGLAALIYFRRGEGALEDYLFALAATNVVCFFGFMVFPIAGPLYYMPEAYTVPLKGWFFTACGEYIRHNVHEIGGSLPSPHCAIATVMWVMARRYARTAFYVLTPVILSLYVSTFFLRYHYVTDSVAGILTAALILCVAPRLVRAWNAVVGGERTRA
ncbi:MAG TPA: phosphatase PAP2 family protein [Thermoanaerobaculaceae bacterium]|nr:phosphatase PAP2 family protein [Thermoanaerobaculaceae bacterium]